MERYTVSQAVLDEIQSDTTQVERATYTEQQIRDITNLCRHHGVARGVTIWNHSHPATPCNAPSAYRWLAAFKKTHSHTVPKKRGRSLYLDEVVEEEIITTFLKVRKAGEPVDTTLMCSIARGVMTKRLQGPALKKNGGAMVFSPTWARSFLHRHGARVYGGTTTRTATAEEIVAAGQQYFDDIRSTKSLPENTYNMDEFFALLHGTTRKWTWQLSRNKAQVVLREHKAGFTCSVLTAASGDTLLLQLIWKGKTPQVHAHVDQEDPRIMQMHRDDTHFQDSSTFEVWFRRFAEIADARRERPTDPVCLIIDAAPQHNFDAMDDLCETHNIHIVTVPPTLTHAYQPADQYIIAHLKQNVQKAWNAYVEEIFTSHDADSAIAKIYTQGLPVTRKKKYEFLVSALDRQSNAAVLASWATAGIFKYCWSFVCKETAIVDIMRQQAPTATHVVIESDESDTDSDCELVAVGQRHAPPAPDPAECSIEVEHEVLSEWTPHPLHGVLVPRLGRPPKGLTVDVEELKTKHRIKRQKRGGGLLRYCTKKVALQDID